MMPLGCVKSQGRVALAPAVADSRVTFYDNRGYVHLFETGSQMQAGLPASHYRGKMIMLSIREHTEAMG